MPAMNEPIDVAFGLCVVVVALLASGHAVIYKREPRSAAMWALVIWGLPAVGAVMV